MSGIFGGILEAVTRAAVFVLSMVGHLLTSTTAVDLTASWFTNHYRAMVLLSGTFAVIALVATAFEASIRSEPMLLFRAMFLHLPVAGLVVAVGIRVTTLALTGVDQLSASFDALSGHGSTELVKTMVQLSVLSVATGGGIPGLLSALLGLITILASVALWCELLLRSAAIAIVVLFLPLTMAAQVWPQMGRAAKRLVELLIALVLSKFVIVAVLSLAASAISGQSGVAGMLIGITMLLLASFSPFLVLRIVPLAEAVLSTGLEGQRQRATRSATTLGRAAMAGASAIPVGVGAGAIEHLVQQSTTGGLPPNIASSEGPVNIGGVVGITPPPPRPPARTRAPLGIPASALGDHVLTHDAFGPVLTFVERGASSE